MDASFNSGIGHGSDAAADRTKRRRAIAVAPVVDGLEDRQLLSQIGGPRQVRVMKHRAAVIQRAKLRAARRFPAPPAPVVTVPATITSQNFAPPTPTITTVGGTVNSMHPIVRLLGTGNIGIKITKPNIPSHILPPETPAPTAPATQAAAPATEPAKMSDTKPADASAKVLEAGATESSLPSESFAPTPPNPLDVAVIDAYDQFSKDAQKINDKSQVTPAMLAALRDDYIAIDKAAKAPADPAKITSLQGSLKAVGDKLPTQVQKAQIKLDVAALIASRGVSDSALIEKTLNDADAILNAANITEDDLKVLSADSLAIAKALDAQIKGMSTTVSIASISDLVAPAVMPGSTSSSTPPAPTMPKAMESILSGLYGPLLGISSPESLTWSAGQLVSMMPPLGSPMAISSQPFTPPDSAGQAPGGRIDMGKVVPVLV